MLAGILLVAVLIVILWRLSRKPDKFPPGPFRWPFVGSGLWMYWCGQQPHLICTELARKYGNVMGFYMYRTPIIVITGYQEMKEALAKPEFQGRPVTALHIIENERKGILMNDGSEWLQQRRFAFRHLRDLGMGTSRLDTIMQEEALAILDTIKSFAGPGLEKPVQVRDVVNTIGTNLVSRLLFDKRFDPMNKQLQYLHHVMRSATTNTDATGRLWDSVPAIARFFGNFVAYKYIKKARQAIKVFINEVIAEHKKTLDRDQPRDLTDQYLLEIQKGEDSAINEKQLTNVSLDLFLAGSDTTVGALALALLYLTLQQETQKKLHEELDRVIGRDRLPTISDKPSLPYGEAVILETLRLGSIVPLSVPHSCICSEEYTEFRGFRIPKGSRVLMNIYGMQTDPVHWEQPLQFRPERFLDESGKVKRPEAYLPFGSGKRSCVGEPLARANLFVSVSVLMQSLELKPVPGEPQPPMDPEGFFTLVAQPFRVKVNTRK